MSEPFSAIVRSLRERAGLSLRQVEASSGVSNAYLSQIESGKVGAPSPKILERLAGALGASYVDLLAAAGHLDLADVSTVARMSRPLLDLSDLSEGDRIRVTSFVQDLRKRRRAPKKTPLTKRRQD